MAGYNIYAGVGLPTDPNGQAQTSTGVAPQSFDASQAYSTAGMYVPQSANASGGTQGAALGVPGSTMNSGFTGLGGIEKSQYYLPQGSSQDLYSKTLDPFQMSAQLGGGHYRAEDIAALRGASNNAMDPNYSAFASKGINPNQYLDAYKSGGYSDVGRFFQDQSQKGYLNGVNYNIDPTFGLRGSIGDLNFDVMGLPQGQDPWQTYNNWNKYLSHDGIDRTSEVASQISNGINSIQANGGSRGFNYIGSNSQNPDGSYNPYVGSQYQPGYKQQNWWEY